MSCPLGFAPEAALEDLGLPLWGPGVRWGSCLGRRGSGSTRYSGELAARAAGNTVLSKGRATRIGQYAPVFLPGEPPSLIEKPDRPQSTGFQRVRHYRSEPAHIDARLFLPVAALPHWVLIMKVAQLLGLRVGTQNASAAGLMALSESFSKPLVSGNQKASLASLSPYLCHSGT